MTDRLAPAGWFDRRQSPLRSVAYFSPEFGVSEKLAQYAGGLGILAGDHLKAASDLGVPLLGIGLFYQTGYFRQTIDENGRQQERYEAQRPESSGLRLLDGIGIEVDLAGIPTAAQVWELSLEGVRLLLLDPNVEKNDEDGRRVTDRMYGGDREHRIRQEILLGMGGIKLLETLGEAPHVFHMNEGHAGFLGIQRIADFMTRDAMQFENAVEKVRASTAFTTHTPVPEGIDIYSRELVEKYFGKLAADSGMGLERLFEMGRGPDEGDDAPFNMAIMCLHLAGVANGVSKLHGEVSRSMFRHLWPERTVDDVPIGSITNGVHAPTWKSSEAAEGSDDDLWRLRLSWKESMIGYARGRLAGSPSTAEWAESVLDPKVLTIGFARRFALYKRAWLLFSQPDRLKTLLLDSERPIQVLVAGKAHPEDGAAKDMMQDLIRFTRQPEVRHRAIFVEDYDMELAGHLCRGVDIWLNNPRRPLEACGTSGMKAAMNGVLNFSIPDGWWDEMQSPEFGWTIKPAELIQDASERDSVEAERLFDLLEKEIIPMFYERNEAGLPTAWLSKVRSCITELGPQLSASRMVKEYVEQLYEPLAYKDNPNQ